MCLYPFARTNVIFSKKPMCFAIWARDGARWHTILEFVPSCPICGWLAWWCDFFPVGPTFENHPQVFGQKGPAPCASTSSSHFFGWWSWTYVSVPLCKANVSSALQIMNQSEFWIQWFEWVCLYFWPLYLHFAFRERPFWSFEPSFRLSRAPACHIKHAFGN